MVAARSTWEASKQVRGDPRTSKKKPAAREGVEHVVVVGVRVIPVPVQDVIAHVQRVARDVRRRVPHRMELVPQDALLPACIPPIVVILIITCFPVFMD